MECYITHSRAYLRWPQIKGGGSLYGRCFIFVFLFFCVCKNKGAAGEKIKSYCNSHGSGAGADTVQRTADNISLCILQHTCMYNNILYLIYYNIIIYYIIYYNNIKH